MHVRTYIRTYDNLSCFNVFTGPSHLTVNIIKNIEISSIVVQWDVVDDSLRTTYTVTWTSERDHNLQVATLKEQSSYTITGLTLDTVYTITVAAANKCGAGPEFATSISFSADTTSTTSSISPTVTASTNPMTIMSTANPNTATAATSSNTITANTTTSIALHSTNGLINSSVTTTNSMTTTVIRDTDTTSSTTKTTSLKTINVSPSVTITTAITNTDTTTTTTRVAKKSNVAVATTATTTTTTTITVVSCTPTTMFGNPADTTSKSS